MPPLPHFDSTDSPDEPDAPAAGTLVEHFFRHEAGRLHGALVRRLGMQHLTLVEDVVQEAMLRALHTWSMGGIPPNPSAWISRVAINLAHDALRHRGMAVGKEDAVALHQEQLRPDTDALVSDEQVIRDDTLRLLFICCHPLIAPDAQAMLALKIICGFSTGEIARAFLGTEAATEKQLTRTKQRLRQAGGAFDLPVDTELAARLDGVLAALYLLFNEGYKASDGDSLLREDLCREAIRLTSLLVKHPAGDVPAAHALLALMLLHSARFPTRTDADGALLRLAEQDRTAWDRSLIDCGLQHLGRAAAGNTLTEYHLQAGIAACHCLAPDAGTTDWDRILAHYDELLRRRPSPVVALNRAVAVANRHGPRVGLDAIAAIPDAERLETQHLVHAVVGELHQRLGEHRQAAASFRRALALARVGPEQTHLTRQLEQLEADAAPDDTAPPRSPLPLT